MLQDTARIAVSVIVQSQVETLQTPALPIHQQIRDRLQKCLAEVPTPSAKRAEEIIARETKFLQSSLSPFLTTPLRSDAGEVNRIVGEALSRCLKEGSAESVPRLVTSASGRMLSPEKANEQLKPLADAGLKYLERTFSFHITPQSCVTEVTALLEGGVSSALIMAALDESVSRFSHVATYRAACGSVAVPVGYSGSGDGGRSAFESVLTFRVPRSVGTPFTASVAEAVAQSSSDSGMLAYSVWKMLSPYSLDDTMQLRVVWRHEEGMAAGVRQILSSGGDESFRTAARECAAWFKHLTE